MKEKLQAPAIWVARPFTLRGVTETLLDVPVVFTLQLRRGVAQGRMVRMNNGDTLSVDLVDGQVEDGSEVIVSRLC